MENRCKDVVDALADRAGLAPEDAQVVAAHLAVCPNCRAIELGLLAVPELVRSAMDDSIDADANRALASDALAALIATADERLREVLIRSLTPLG